MPWFFGLLLFVQSHCSHFDLGSAGVIISVPSALSVSGFLCFKLMAIYLFSFPPLLPATQSLLRCHPAGIGRHTALNIPELVSEEARSLLEQVRVCGSVCYFFCLNFNLLQKRTLKNKKNKTKKAHTHSVSPALVAWCIKMYVVLTHSK